MNDIGERVQQLNGDYRSLGYDYGGIGDGQFIAKVTYREVTEAVTDAQLVSYRCEYNWRDGAWEANELQVTRHRL